MMNPALKDMLCLKGDGCRISTFSSCLIGHFRVRSPSKSRSAVLTEVIWVAEDSSYNKTMPMFSAPVLKGEAIDAAEVLGVVGNDRPLVAEAGG